MCDLEYSNEWFLSQKTKADLSEIIVSVEIPSMQEHNEYYKESALLRWVCPICGNRRGKPYNTISYDGSRRLSVNGWENACGHVDYYSAVRTEALANGNKSHRLGYSIWQPDCNIRNYDQTAKTKDHWI